eukprot:TRINITY_DN96851_c0_g1_i1.p1 TRINITY_DN96851_c0_g1~~TRINITY_DN96851_c0_g1_i1.p1  ORF type:complete len:348 (+),score=54.68 TRINITY_DN96851_c0_g1_i1:80-1123(+)
MKRFVVLACVLGANALMPEKSGELVAHGSYIKANVMEQKFNHDAHFAIRKDDSSQQIPYLWLRILVCGVILGSIFGMMGGGGALILKPMLYYIFYIQPFKMTIFSCYAIIAPLSLLGAMIGQYKNCVVWADVGKLFILTSLLGASLGACVAQVIPDLGQLLLFAVLLVAVATHTWWKALAAQTDKPKPQEESNEKQQSASGQAACVGAAVSADGSMASVRVVMTAVLVGVMTGSLGVGGGFMLTPLLCHMGHKMDTAVPTSLAVIFFNSVVSMVCYHILFAMSLPSSNVSLMISFVLIGCLGILASGHVASMLSQSSHQKVYASLLLILGFGTIIIEGMRTFHWTIM